MVVCLKDISVFDQSFDTWFMHSVARFHLSASIPSHSTKQKQGTEAPCSAA